MSHTPGPWAAELVDDDGRYKKWRVGPHVADVFYETPEGEGNAMLIAAAPDLLHACELLLIYLGDWDDPEDETCIAARRAISKAKGGE